MPLGTVLETPRSSIMRLPTSDRAAARAPSRRCRRRSARPCWFGMNAVALVQLGLPGDVVEQERNERAPASRSARSRNAWRNAMAYSGPKFGGASMPARITTTFRSRARVDDLRQVLLHLGDREPAQPVVGAERDDQDSHVPFERPVEPPQPAGRRVARDAGVDDFELVAVGVDLLLQQRRIRLLSRAARGRRSGCRRARRSRGRAGGASGSADGRRGRGGCSRRLALGSGSVAAAAGRRQQEHASATTTRRSIGTAHDAWMFQS